jgi:hypothetical protein
VLGSSCWETARTPALILLAALAPSPVLFRTSDFVSHHTQADFLVRALVQTLGCLLIGFGVFLWLAGPRSAYKNPPLSPPVTAPVSVKLTPTVPKPRRIIASAQPKQEPAQPEQEQPVSPKREPLSTTVLTHVWPTTHLFKVLLHKEDGWYDTGIPISSDLMVNMWCLPQQGDNPACSAMVDAMAGGDNVLDHSLFELASPQQVLGHLSETPVIRV